MRFWLSRLLLNVSAHFLPVHNVTHDHMREVTSVIIFPWKYGKRAEMMVTSASVVVLEDK